MRMVVIAMRLIDADGLREWLRKIPIHDLSDGKGLCRVIFEEDFARSMQTFDGNTIEIVRCKDCAKYRTGECPMDQGYPWFMSDLDDFCSSGVRIGVGDNGEDGKQAQEAVCGRWKRHGWHGGECECPVCGSLWERMENKTEHFNFCPCCGARMRRELAHGDNVQCCGCKHQFGGGCELDLFVTKGGSHWANHTCKDREVESSEAGETEEASET